MEALLRILHLEDDPVDGELIRERLEQEGLRVQLIRVDSLDAFSRELRATCFDAIFSDYTVPGTDPRDALKLAREQCPHVPFIFVSGTIGEDLAIETMRLGAADYVLKERLARLMPTLRRALRESKEAALRKEAQSALGESERRLRLAMEIGAIGSFDMDAATGQVTWDEQGMKIFGLQTPDADVWKLIHPEDAGLARQNMQNALDPQRREPFAMEIRFVEPDGHVCWVAVRGRGVFDDFVDPPKTMRLVGVVQEVTARKRDEESLRDAKLSAEKAKEIAEQAVRAKDHFLAILSHELRTPLTAVLPALDALRPLVPPAGTAYLDMASRNALLEARLIDDLLDITRIARGKIELQREKVDLRDVIKRAAEVCKAEIVGKGLHFAMNLKGSEQWVDGDPARLQQVFWNLIQNAVKFTPSGGCIGVVSEMLDGKVLAEVHDSGTGIDREAMARIFMAFEQEAKSVTRQFGGLGLGLAICRVLVEMHGGTIRAKSEGKDKGASFIVELPSGPADSGVQPSSRSADAVKQEPAPAGLRILLVEDHADTARIITHLLTRAGHRVKHASDVATGLQLARADRFDLMVSDLGLPDGSGHDLMRQIVREGVALPAIALSGYGMAEDIQKSRESGFIEHITKPINFAFLQNAISRVLAQRRSA